MTPEHIIYRFRFLPEPGADYAFDIIMKKGETEDPVLRLRRHLASVINQINEGLAKKKEDDEGLKLSDKK